MRGTVGILVSRVSSARVVCRGADVEAREKLNLDCLLPRHGTNPMKDP